MGAGQTISQLVGGERVGGLVKNEPKKDRRAEGAEENKEGDWVVGKQVEVEDQAAFSVSAAESVSRR